MTECRKTVTLINRLGLHVRAATQLVKTAESFQSQVLIDREGFDQVNGKSIMSVLTLAAAKGAKLTFTTRGTDAEKAMEVLVALIQERFGEED